MSFIKKFTTCVRKQVSETMEGLGISDLKFSSLITKRYPDIDEVIEVLEEMKKHYDESDGMKTGIDEENAVDDEKWRPMFLTIGLLYKLQRIHDSHPSSWYNQEHIFVHDDDTERAYMQTLGYYWHYCMRVAEALRTIDNETKLELPTDEGNAQNDDEGPKSLDLLPVNEQIFSNLIETTGLKREEILFAHATDSFHVDHHCPDFAVVLLHDLKQILIVICGTRMIPAPKMKDVFMDLYADSKTFLHGQAHMGMAMGANNIRKKILPQIVETLASHPDYNIMVIGYSLGAGICQLLTMDLLENPETVEKLPEGVTVRCISYGSPPVFRSDNPNYKSGNIFSVVYNNDGLASASVASMLRLFQQIREVDRLLLRRRDMIKMLWDPVPLSEGNQLKEDDDDEDDDFQNKSGSHKTVVLDPESNWYKVKQSIEKVQECDGLVQLGHPARQLFLLKRKDDDIITRLLSDTDPLSTNLRLRGSMFNHHMPWGYNFLFTGYGESKERVNLDVLDVVDQQLLKTSENKGSLYPNLSNV